MEADVRTVEEIKEKLGEMLTYNFTITKCPEKTFRAFQEFCKNETNNNYAFGLKLLLESREANIKEIVLYEQYAELRDRIEALEQKGVNVSEEKKKLKTMGSGAK